MLSQDELEEMSTDLVDIYANTEIKLIIDIAKRLNGLDKFTDDINDKILELNKKGYTKEKIIMLARSYIYNQNEFKRYVAENNNSYKKFLKKALMPLVVGGKLISKKTVEKTAKATFKDDVSKWKELGLKTPKDKNLDSMGKKYVKNTVKEVSNINKHLCFRLTNNKIPVGSAFKHNVDIAMQGIISGRETKDSALSKCVKEMSRSGMRGIVGEIGKGRTVEVVSYARQTLATNLNRLCGDISNENIKETDVEYVEVDTTSCPRDAHAEWEGKVYTYDEFVEATGFGDGTDPDNIYSYNCYHHHYPLKFKSQAAKYHKPSKNVSYDGKKISRFDASQIMRKTERDVRALSREYQVNKELGLPNTEVKASISEKKNFYRDFAKQTDIAKKEHRFNIYD